MDATSDTDGEPTGYRDKWLRLKRRRARPFVGYEGIGCRLTVSEEQGRLRITGANSNYVWIILMLAAFGPGLNAIAYLEWETFQTNHWAMLGLLGIFNLIAWGFLFKYLWEVLAGRPVVEVPFGDSELLLRRGDSADPYRRFNRSEIDRFMLVETAYRSDGNMHENYTIRLVTKDGTSIDLCTSDERPRVEMIGSQLADRFKVRLSPPS